MAQQVHDGAIEAFGAAIAAKTAQGGAVAGVFGWLINVNWIGLMGVLIGLLGLAANFYFQRRRDKREANESEERIKAMREQCSFDVAQK